MRIGVNCRILSKSTPTGTARYARNLLAASLDLPDVSPEPRFSLFGVADLPEALRGHDRVEVRPTTPPSPSGLRAHVWEQLTLPRSIRTDAVDAFHTPAGHPPILAGTPTITTIHDISPIRHPEWFSTRYALLYRLVTPLSVRASDRVVTVSEFARREILDTYPAARGKTVAVHNGVTPRDSGTATPVDGVDPGNYLLFVGSVNPRKNIDGLIEAYGTIRRDRTDPPELVLAGPSSDNFAADGLPAADAVDGLRPLGFVSDDRLAWLYRNARAFVFPSLYEGFGLPILEAMSAGTPVVTSDRGAMAEVAGDAARLVDPEDPEAIAAGVDALLEDGEYAAALAAAGRRRAAAFSWEQTARETLRVYRAVVDGS